MSRIYEALRRMELERRSPDGTALEQSPPVEFLQSVVPQPVDLRAVPSLDVHVTAASRLVALNDPQGLGAEKFRALATRLENMRNQRELKTLLVTSSVAHEGKTLIAVNLAVTFAQHSGAKVLLVEGDLHNPVLASLIGIQDFQGISQWWSARDAEISKYIYRFGHIPLWLLPAGRSFDQPSNILQSARFAEALLGLIGTFDWIIVDSAPLLPFVDANLWSRLLDGMLLVVREGVAPVKALKKGLESIDNLNLVGVVLNDATDSEHPHYQYKYSDLPKQEKAQA